MKCLLCANNHFEILRKKLRYGVKRDVLVCKKCGYVFLRPQNSKVKYDNLEYRKVYGPKLGKNVGPKERFDTYLPYQKEISEQIAHLFKPQTSILDVGCSAGFFLSSLKGKVKTRVGLELNPDDARFIKKNLDFKVYNKPLEEVGIEEGPFDIITSLQVLEHIEDPVSFLKNISKNLKPEGWLYLELPNINDILLSVFKEPSYSDFYYREPHVSYFSQETLRRVLDKAGFVGKIKTIQRYNFMNHLNWILCHKPQLNFNLGNDPAKLINENPGEKSEPVDDLNSLIKKTDKDYKKIVVKYGLGETLCFLGKKKKT